ncbi:MAG: hypothetical protein QXU75_08475, partial [Candidatus Methanomethylicaceae archaeon]
MGQLFSIGKIIQIRKDRLAVRRLAFIETEEHIRHVVEMLSWLYPDAGDRLKKAAELHDLGKKIYLERDFAQNGRRWDSRLTQEKLRADFYRLGSVKEDIFKPEEAIKRYLAFLERGAHVKCSVVRQNSEDPNSPIIAARYQLDPPFGNHAASLEVEDLHGVPDEDLDYVHGLIQLHHSFQVDKLVAMASRYGEEIIRDLYRLMTADQEGSRWAEYVVQQLESGEEKPQGKFGFSEFAVEVSSEPQEILRDGSHVQGQVMLKATRRPDDLGELKLSVDYYVADCELTPDKFLSPRKKGGRK